MPNKWTDWVSKWARDHNMTYPCAIKDPACKAGYTKVPKPIMNRNIYGNPDKTRKKRASIADPANANKTSTEKRHEWEDKNDPAGAEARKARRDLIAENRIDYPNRAEYRAERLRINTAKAKKQQADDKIRKDKEEKERLAMIEANKPENRKKQALADAQEKATKINKDGLGNSILKGIINGTKNLETKENRYKQGYTFLYPRELWLGKIRNRNNNFNIYQMSDKYDKYGKLFNTGMEWDGKKLILTTDYSIDAGQYYHKVAQYALNPKGTGLTQFSTGGGNPYSNRVRMDEKTGEYYQY